MSKQHKQTPIAGIHYYEPPEESLLSGLDGRLTIPFGEIALPLLEEDFQALAEKGLTYDVVGRGIYQALRSNPDCDGAASYAQILKEAYPHYVAELASQIVMFDKKDVETPYLDRKINYLKVFALIEPDNPQIPREIGLTLLDKGLRLSALTSTTVTLYRAESFLRTALALGPDDIVTKLNLGEVSFILGKYEQASVCWRDILSHLPASDVEKLNRRLEGIESGRLPLVPAVDYLEAIGVAFESHLREEFEEAAAILRDVLDDEVFRTEFPLPSLHYYLGICCARLGMPQYAEECLNEALRLDPGYEEAQEALKSLNS